MLSDNELKKSNPTDKFLLKVKKNKTIENGCSSRDIVADSEQLFVYREQTIVHKQTVKWFEKVRKKAIKKLSFCFQNFWKALHKRLPELKRKHPKLEFKTFSLKIWKWMWKVLNFSNHRMILGKTHTEILC